MRILLNNHEWYNYLDTTLAQGLKALGNEVMGTANPATNYCDVYDGKSVDLFVQCIAGGGLARMPVRQVMLWGEDSHQGLADVFTRGFDAVFVRDYVDGPGIPISFGIETRYLCATENGLKPLSEREIDICFLGDLAGYKGNRLKFTQRLKEDFKSYNLELGPRKFSEPDTQWSRWTKPWCAHDPRYFEALANSKICLSFKGAGPDTGRTWESLASGAVCLIEEYNPATFVPPYPKSAHWFVNYEGLSYLIDKVLSNLNYWQELQEEAWETNVENHSTKARAAYFLEKLGY